MEAWEYDAWDLMFQCFRMVDHKIMEHAVELEAEMQEQCDNVSKVEQGAQSGQLACSARREEQAAADTTRGVTNSRLQIFNW